LLILLVVWPWPWSGRAGLPGRRHPDAHIKAASPSPYPADIALLKKTWWPTADIAISKKLAATLAHAHIAPTLKTLSDFSRSHADIALSAKLGGYMQFVPKLHTLTLISAPCLA
jgi:hypothetical protein